MKPKYQIAVLGDSVTISCSGNLNGTKWYKEGDQVPSYYMRGYDSTATELTVVIYFPSVTLKDSGVYTCAGWRVVDNDIADWIKESTLAVGGIFAKHSQLLH